MSRFVRVLLGWCLVSTVAVCAVPLPGGADPVPIYSTGWEGGAGTWCADNGVWAVDVVAGTPQGTMAAGTVPLGNYPSGANSRFVSPAVSLPGSPADGTLLLSFHHTFNLAGGDSCYVEIGTGGTICGAGTTWQRVGSAFVYSSGEWSRYLVDISEYAGQSIRVGLHIKDNGDIFQAPGWRVDSLEMMEGAYPSWSLEGFESGYRGWHADQGAWRIASGTGTPAGTEAAISGNNYPRYADTRLVSSPITLPTPPDGVLSLSYYQWFNLAGGDSGHVEVSVSGGSWQRVLTSMAHFSGFWTRCLVDLSSYAGLSVRIAFHLQDNGDIFQAPGWSVDSLELIEGGYPPWSPEGFESGHRGWYADQGVWRILVDGTAPEGTQVATGGDNYPRYADSRLIAFSARLDPPPSPPPVLAFSHAFAFAAGDTGWVEVSIDGGEWEKVSPGFTGAAGTWSQHFIDFVAYLGKRIRVAFHLKDNGDIFQGTGWRIDQVSLETLTPVLLALASVGATPEAVVIDWYAAEGTLNRAQVQRRTAESPWNTIGEVLADGVGHLRYTDTAVEPGARYAYRLSTGTGPEEEFGGEVWVDVPTHATFALEGLRPNPAPRELTVAFTVDRAGPVQIALYDLGGRSVLTRRHEIDRAGWHGIVLAGAREVPAGVYFIRLTQGTRSLTTRACVVR